MSTTRGRDSAVQTTRPDHRSRASEVKTWRVCATGHSGLDTPERDYYWQLPLKDAMAAASKPVYRVQKIAIIEGSVDQDRLTIINVDSNELLVSCHGLEVVEAGSDATQAEYRPYP